LKFAAKMKVEQHQQLTFELASKFVRFREGKITTNNCLRVVVSLHSRGEDLITRKKSGEVYSS